MRLRLLFLFLCAFTTLAAQVKLAVVETSADLAPQGSLLTAALTKATNVSLLERANLDKLLREQSLAATQVTNILRAGQLLGADGVVLLETSGPSTNKELNVRLVSVKEGAVLYSSRSSITLTNVDRWAQTFSLQIASVAAKIGADRSKVIPISILNFRSPNPSPVSELLDRELTSLVLLRFTRQTNLLVLERRKLLDIAFEKDLAARAELFWSGAYLLDGIVNKEGFSADRATVSARLVAPDKSVKIIESSGARTNLAAIVDDLLAKTLQSLKLTGITAWDQKREAQEHADEAAWSLRWGMLREAQAAGDSAWALGERTRGVAINRALAYARDYAAFDPSFASGGVASLGVLVNNPPSRERFEAVYAGVTILHELIARDADALEERPTHNALCEILAASGRVLEAYYFLVDLREGLEDQLGELRRMSREVEAIARAHPAIRKPFWNAFERGLDDRQMSELFEPSHTTNFPSVSLMYSSMFHDTPESVLPVYRDLFAADAFPAVSRLAHNRIMSPPLVSGWKWADRKRSVAVWDGFISELLASTNLALQIEGRELEILEQTDWSVFRRKMDELLAFADKNWSEIAARKLSPRLRAMSSLSFHAADRPQGEEEELEVKVAQSLVDHGVYGKMLLNGHEIVPRKQIAESPKPIQRANAADPSPILHSDVLVVTNFWRANAADRDNDFGQRLLSPIFRENKLWFRINSSIYAMDLLTMNFRTIRFKSPESFFSGSAMFLDDYKHLGKSLEVRSNILYVAQGLELHRIDLATDAQTSAPIPEANPDIYQVNGRLYLSGTNSIYEIDDRGEARLLASSRRRPAATLLDEMDAFNFPVIAPDPNAALRAFIRGDAYSWDGKNWSRELELWKFEKDSAKLDCIPFENGCFLATVGFPPVIQLFSISNTESKPHYLAAGLRGAPDDMRGHTNRWLLDANHILHGAPAFVRDIPVVYLPWNLEKPKEPDYASLLVVKESAANLVEIPLRFEQGGGKSLRAKYDMGWRRMWLLDTPVGLVIGHAALRGFALIPREEIDAAISRALVLAEKPIQTSALPKP